MPIILIAIILTVVQGITEYLPVSSSTHTNLVKSFFSTSEPEALTWLIMTVIATSYVSFGTFLGGLWCLRSDVLQIFKDFWQWIKNPKKEGLSLQSTNLFWVVLVATLPLVLLVFMVKQVDLPSDNNFVVVAIELILFGWALYYFDRQSQTTPATAVSLKHGFWIGLSQFLALAHSGVSRTGITITIGRYLGYERIKALRFGLLLGLPTILGTSLLGFKELEKSKEILGDMANIAPNLPPVWDWSYLGMVAGGFILSVIVIKWMLWFFKDHDFKIIAWYRTAVGILILVLAFLL